PAQLSRREGRLERRTDPDRPFGRRGPDAPGAQARDAGRDVDRRMPRPAGARVARSQPADRAPAPGVDRRLALTPKSLPLVHWSAARGRPAAISLRRARIGGPDKCAPTRFPPDPRDGPGFSKS